jgi:hypothetical protein
LIRETLPDLIELFSETIYATDALYPIKKKEEIMSVNISNNTMESEYPTIDELI